MATGLTLTSVAVQRAGIVVAPAGPQRIDTTIEAPGEIALNTERVVEVSAPYAGTVRQVHRRLGDPVRAGQTLALVHSNESLTNYAIRAPQSGTVVARSCVPGQATGPDASLFTIADLSTVWVTFTVYAQDLAAVRRGQVAHIETSETGRVGAGTVSYIGPLLNTENRASQGRIVLPNPGHVWQPGLFVTVRIVTASAVAAIAVPDGAIVRTDDGPAVFRAAGRTFTLQPVTTGRTDGTTTEIISGLVPGTPVVVQGAFALKAELGKAGERDEE